MTRLVLSVAALFVFVQTVGYVGRVEAAVYNLHLVTDKQPDYTDIDSFVESVTGKWKTPQEKCIAIWRWGRRSRRQTSCATDDGRLVWDPILHYNSYGTMNCGVISGLNIASFIRLGYEARYVQLGDHTVSEVSWDKGESWHLFDSSMSFFCYNHAGEVASCQEIKETHACELSGGKSEPGHYYLYHGAPQCVSHLGAWNEGRLVVRHRIPYSDIKDLAADELQSLVLERGESVCFGHTLHDLIQGQIDAGFVLAGFYEDKAGDGPLDAYIDSFFATRAIKMNP